MKTFIAFVTLLMSLNSFAGTKITRVTSKIRGETRYVKIIENGDNMQFKFCDSRANRCSPLGPENNSSRKISRKMKIEFARMGAVAAADLGIFVAGWAGGVALGAALYSAEVIGFLGFNVTVAGSVVSSQVAALTTETLNPVTYGRAANTARTVNLDRDSSRYDIVKFKNNLEKLLYEIQDR